MKSRRPVQSSPYYLPKEIYNHVVSFCRCYPYWVKELETLPDGNKAIDYSGDKVQSSGGYDVTSAIAMKRVEVERKVNAVNTTAMIVSPDLWEWLVKGVTEDYTIQDLIQQGMPCCRQHYSKIRAYFYYLLSKRI